MHFAIHSIMRNPAALVEMMEQQCTSATVTTEPLLGTYYEMQRKAAVEAGEASSTAIGMQCWRRVTGAGW